MLMETKRETISQKTDQEIAGKYEINEAFVIEKSLIYLLRFLNKYGPVNGEVVEFVLELLGSRLDEFLDELGQHVEQQKQNQLTEDLKSCYEIFDYKHAIMKLYKNSKKANLHLLPLMITFLKKRLNDLSNRQTSEIEIKAKEFQKIFSLNNDEIQLCLFFFLLESWKHMNNFFNYELDVYKYSGRKFLQTILDFSYSELEQAISGKLFRIGITNNKKDNILLNEDFLRLFMDPQGAISSGSLYKEIGKSNLPMEYHLIPEEKVQLVKGLLSHKRNLPSHILLYGPPGTGKTSFARSLVNSLVDRSYEIIHENENSSGKRRAAIEACLNLTNHQSGSIIVVDEADNLLNTAIGFFAQGEVRDKGWLNSLMDEAGARMIWIVNHIDNIEESVLRRFSYSLNFPKFSRQKRVILWKNIVKHNKAGRFIKNQAIQDLARNYEVCAGVIDLTVKQAIKTRSCGGLLFADRVRLALEAHVQLNNRGVASATKLKQAKDDFIIEGLNIDVDLSRIIDELRTFKEFRCLRKSHIHQYSLLFYGPSGTGKSELARYLSRELELDLVTKRGSDLLSPYVGVTEQNIAGMFAEAEAKEAILIIDEVDSFIYGRDTARHSWEVGHVNEFLTRMEQYSGIMICTTNRFNHLDQASIRRFNRKIGFDYLTSRGNQLFFEKLLAPMAKTCPRKEDMDRLKQLTTLTPGDFKIIQSRFVLYPKQVAAVDMIKELEDEKFLKSKQKGEKPLGFTNA